MPDDRPSDRLLTYAELGELLAISADGARTKTKRAGWPVIPGNDGRARVRVPMAELPKQRPVKAEQPPERSPEQARSHPEQNPSISALLAELRARAERAERSAEQARAEAEQARITIARLEEQKRAVQATVDEQVKAARAVAEQQVMAARAVAVADVATAEAKVEARDMVIAELKEMLAEARRPWWRRWLEL